MNQVTRYSPVLISIFALVFLAFAQAERLHSPWDERKIVSTDAPYTCPNPPELAPTLDAEGYYTDSHNSVVDPAKKAAYDKASEGPVHLGQFAGAAADAYLSTGSKAAAACVYSLLGAAAQADAWAGKMAHGQDVYTQNWLLSGTAIPYLKVRNSGAGSTQQDAEIQGWFRHLAQRVRTYFDEGKEHPGSDAYNNHIYWAGLSLAAAGIAADDREAFTWGIESYFQGVESIQLDGSLQAEMNRAGRALHYQLYALGPLVILAELGEANGIPMYSAHQGAIHRLVQFNVAAVEDPETIAKRAGVAQDIVKPLSGLEIGWAVPYVKRFPDPRLSAMIAAAPWLRFWQWGGAPPDPEIPRPPVSAGREQFEASLRSSANEIVRVQLPHNPSQIAAFLGAWCGQGDPANHASISNSGAYLTLDNGEGDASTGRVSGKHTIIAPGWQNVTGKLTPKATQIDWSNGSYWERCDAAVADHRQLDLSGKWYPQGDLSHPCSIRQHDVHIDIDCRQAGKAHGRIDGVSHLTSNWSGQTIGATITPDGNHLNWENRTYWTRSTVYQP